MRWLKHLLVGLLALLLIAMLVVYLTPLDAYVPEVEQALGDQLHDQVSIQHIRIAALPLPHLELQGVRLGKQDGIAAQSVSVELDFPSLFAGKKVISRIVVKDGTASYAKVRKLAAWFGSATDLARIVEVRELQLSGMSLLTPDMRFGPAEGKLEFANSGKLERAWFAMNEQKVTAILLPLPDQHFSVKLQASAWTPSQFPRMVLDDLQVEGVLSERDFVVQKGSVALQGMRASGSGKVEFSDGWRIQGNLARVDAPLGKVMALLESEIDLNGALHAKGQVSSNGSSLGELRNNFRFAGDVNISHVTVRIASGFQHPLAFDEIRAHVVVQPERVAVSALEARLYGGKLSGSAVITRKDALLAADATTNGIAIQSLVEALTNEVLFSGSMDSAVKLSMRLDDFDHFPENLQLDGNFHIRNGALSKVDLINAASNPGKPSSSGGKTRFDNLTCLINVNASGYHFRKIKITSGSLNADGKIDVNPALQLSGMLDTNVRGTIGLVSMPMMVSGTLNNPIVRPSGTALAGAAVGTAILGPGLGTAIGIKIGGFLNKLFGNNDEKKDAKQSVPSKPAKK